MRILIISLLLVGCTSVASEPQATSAIDTSAPLSIEYRQGGFIIVDQRGVGDE